MINEKMRLLGANRSVIRELFEYGKKRKSEIGEEKVFDFSLGNPSVCAPKEVSENLIKLIEEENPISLHGYTSAQGDKGVRDAIAAYVNERHLTSYNGDCFYMTVGAAAALTCSLTALVCPGEEVIVLSPYFPEYRVFVERCGGVLREVLCESESFQPDIDAIREAINEKTAAIIINSPNNPTGAVYTEESLIKLSNLLSEYETKYKRSIYIICDEPYRELGYDGVKVPFIPKIYKNTVVSYSFSKSLSLPGERIGYCLVPDTADNNEAVYSAIAGAGRALGFVCAPSLLQKLIPHCLGKTADITVYNKNRTILFDSLTSYGFKAVKPDGAFYLFLKAPDGDSVKFCEAAKKKEILVVPSDSFGCSGYVRIAYCVDTELIERSLDAFRALAEEYGLI